jgi:predicted DNA-binding transcriptional regulator AlpA
MTAVAGPGEAPPRFINRKELAALLRVTIGNTYRMSLPPVIRITSRVHRWDREVVEKWIRQRTAK